VRVIRLDDYSEQSGDFSILRQLSGFSNKPEDTRVVSRPCNALLPLSAAAVIGNKSTVRGKKLVGAKMFFSNKILE
jgi:hypothetical protein